ncbi:hypothetical protein TWF225_012005 [Orbilia oligospora]|uniref:Uncharacterized protein n=1 Tax=Orbilia oligospora TaxID=2813651 RepID=A0A7C8KIP0_ORBOL|nr:hypothetical protein TWF225_012005 [Orbilia oligospora]KAF3175290.1 hypothetical protein TWF751_004489 [Orbilia oligospora]KAF3239015.1 hypothetical protein TWF128_011887 [Orbilia oligospora]KAF3244285.1 hypothetical protein TWF217_010786 [Orbilia oligospora]KAF3283507.1 hypothetical protein TWF132_010313 [Orbilia oligospora]
MLSRTAALRPIVSHRTSIASRRWLSASSRLNQAVGTPPAATVTVKKSSGGFRGGIIGFLIGSSLAFATSFTYLRNEWKVRDDILMEDFASLRATCQRVEARFRLLEDQIAKTAKK